jgi:flagellar basal-body rod protein FlgC
MAGWGLSATGISASGMAAERRRMEVISNNIANANSTRGADGEPYRRQFVVFSAEQDPLAISDGALSGVKIEGVQQDESPFNEVHLPGHPDADPQTGMVKMPNVKLPNEMVDLITASRSYEANLKALSLFKEMVEQTLTLLRGR